MIGRIVEIADDRRHLFVNRGFMVVRDTEGERKELGQVPLDDIAAVIANAHGITYTNNLLVALAERGAPFVLCAANHNAVGMLLTLDGHHVQSKRIEAQVAASLPTHKRLWASVVKSKLEQQAAALEAAGAPTAPLLALLRRVQDLTRLQVMEQASQQLQPGRVADHQLGANGALQPEQALAQIGLRQLGHHIGPQQGGNLAARRRAVQYQQGQQRRIAPLQHMVRRAGSHHTRQAQQLQAMRRGARGHHQTFRLNHRGQDA